MKFNFNPLLGSINKLKFTFSGHESFQCRHLWLKKGFDFLNGGNHFSHPSSVVFLGVGKNMVASIKYWMRAFDLVDDNDALTPLAYKLLSDDGWDPFLEYEGSLWLLHYHLIKKGSAAIYQLIFNELRKEKIEFTRLHFISFIKRKLDNFGLNPVSEKTLADDFNVFIKMYVRSNEQSKDKEDSYSGLLTELDLIKSLGKKGEDYFVIENNEKNELPLEIFYYSILDYSENATTVNLSNLESDTNGIGNIFAINKKGLIDKILAICNSNSNIVYNDHAGIKQIQFKKKELPFTILERYYAK